MRNISAGLAVLVALSGTAAAQENKQDIKIGFLGTFTGPLSAAGADCGFSSQALYRTEVHNTVVWEKFKAMRQGADIATKQLWS